MGFLKDFAKFRINLRKEELISTLDSKRNGVDLLFNSIKLDLEGFVEKNKNPLKKLESIKNEVTGILDNFKEVAFDPKCFDKKSSVHKGTNKQFLWDLGKLVDKQISNIHTSIVNNTEDGIIKDTAVELMGELKSFCKTFESSQYFREKVAGIRGR